MKKQAKIIKRTFSRIEWLVAIFTNNTESVQRDRFTVRIRRVGMQLYPFFAKIHGLLMIGTSGSTTRA
ncbi:hypothetical protein FRC03_007574 [Tulasnella sp. 419]|nr:hypothetical protein FRC03_007574 [Tulasnella sp. 419]